MFIWRKELSSGWGAAFTSTAAGSLRLGDAQAEQARAHVNSTIGSACQFMRQVHGKDVASVQNLGPEPQADALISTRLALGVLVADCAPVLFLGVAPRGGVAVAAAHAGRRGLMHGVLSAVVSALRECGSEQLFAWIGPTICGACYEVPESMRTEFCAQFPSAAASTSWGAPSLDLPSAATAQLRALEVEVENVGVCSFEEENFFSHRRSLASGQVQGRCAGIVYPMAH